MRLFVRNRHNFSLFATIGSNTMQKALYTIHVKGKNIVRIGYGVAGQGIF